jgi:hypothetical protein
MLIHNNAEILTSFYQDQPSLKLQSQEISKVKWLESKALKEVIEVASVIEVDSEAEEASVEVAVAIEVAVSLTIMFDCYL